MDSTRVDRWLWAVRLAKTRSAASALCKAGHVEVNGRSAKPSTPVTVGDRVTARIHRRDRIAVVQRVIDKRVGAAIAAECYDDHSPVEPAADRTGPTREPSHAATQGPVAPPNATVVASTSGAIATAEARPDAPPAELAAESEQKVPRSVAMSTIRPYENRDRDDVVRIWREVGWIDDSEREAGGLEALLDGGLALPYT